MLVGEARREAGQGRHVEVVEQPFGDALGDQQVALVEDAHESLAPIGQAPAVEVPPRVEELQDPVEGEGERVGVALDLSAEVGDLALRLPELAGGPEVLGPIRAVGHRVAPRRRAGRVARRVRPLPVPAARAHGEPAQRLGHLALVGRAVRRERLGQIEVTDHLGIAVVVVLVQREDAAGLGDPPDAEVAAAPLGHREHGGPARVLAPAYADDVARFEGGERVAPG